jgi:RDD family
VEDRVSAPREPDRDRMRDSFFVTLSKLTLGLVRGQPWRVRAGPITLHEFGEPAPTSSGWCWPIRGGLLTSRPGGYLSFQWRDGHLLSIVDGYWPSLPRPLYNATQLQLHHLITRLFLLQLRGRVPPPGVPGGPAQRLAAATLDLAACSALTLALPRRRRLPAWLALVAGYHAAAWSIFGQTLGGKALGLRVVAIDGGRVTPVQAVLRLLGLPAGLARFRAVHDQLALTEVVEADG